MGIKHRHQKTRKKARKLWLMIAWAGCFGAFAVGCRSSQEYKSNTNSAEPPLAAKLKKQYSTDLKTSELELVSFNQTIPNSEDPSTKASKEKNRQLPINLDTVLRLAEEQNPLISVAREKLEESNAENALAAKSWLPAIYGGIAYYRHEGGIQNFNGDLIQSSTGALYPNLEIRTELDLREATYRQVVSERKHWVTRGELTRISSEICLEAASTYIDLLTARRGEAIARELEKYHFEQLQRAEKLKESQPGSAVMVEAVQAEIQGRKQAISKLKHQGDACSTKLTYLLGIDPEIQLVPVESSFVPVDLVDTSTPVSDMVAKSISYGPGVMELEGMLESVQAGIARMDGPNRLMPIVQINMAEGGFGAGAGSALNWANRWDLGLAVKWNLTEWHQSREKRRITESKLNQVHLTFKDLQAKLTAGVQESREAILSGRDQIRFGTGQIKHAAETYRLNDIRQTQNVSNMNQSDILQSIRGLEVAHTNYVTAINAYNKAQVRLMLLLGPNNAITQETAKAPKPKLEVYPVSESVFDVPRGLPASLRKGDE